nr:MAG TPA: hypothetical protein [Bacteriophage sp.]
MMFLDLSHGYTLLIHFCVRRRCAWGLCCCLGYVAALALPPGVAYPATHPRGKAGPDAPLRKSPEFPKNKKDFRNHIDISKLL